MKNNEEERRRKGRKVEGRRREGEERMEDEQGNETGQICMEEEEDKEEKVYKKVKPKIWRGRRGSRSGSSFVASPSPLPSSN